MAAPLVVVVDDDANQGRKTCVLLRAGGFDAATTMTADGTLTLVEHGLKAAVFAIDLMLPGTMDGNKLAARLRDASPDSKIVVVSGWVQTLQPETEALADAVVEKPIDSTQLLDACRAAVRRGKVE